MSPDYIGANTWVALGVLVLVVAWPLAYVFLRNDPADLGLLPDGDQASASVLAMCTPLPVDHLLTQPLTQPSRVRHLLQVLDAL